MAHEEMVLQTHYKLFAALPEEMTVQEKALVASAYIPPRN